MLELFWPVAIEQNYNSLSFSQVTKSKLGPMFDFHSGNWIIVDFWKWIEVVFVFSEIINLFI